MKKLFALIFVIALAALNGCTNGATFIGNPPLPLPEDNGETGGNTGGGEIGEAASKDALLNQHWAGSVSNDEDGLVIFIASFGAEETTIFSTESAEGTAIKYEISNDGTINTVDSCNSGFAVSGKVLMLTKDGYEAELNLYKNGVLLTKLFKFIPAYDDAISDLLNPVEACIKSQNKCFDTDSFIGIYLAGRVTFDTGDKNSCEETLVDYCNGENELVEYSCLNDGGAEKVKEDHYECSCLYGRCQTLVSTKTFENLKTLGGDGLYQNDLPNSNDSALDMINNAVQF